MIQRFVKMVRCRLCAELFEANPQQVEDTFNAASFELSERCYECSEHEEHICSDGSIGTAFIAGFKLEIMP